MAWPWGGSVTHQQLATKFGWPTVVLSMLILPLTFLWRHLVSCNFLLSLLPHGVFNTVSIYTYPKNDDLVRKELYLGPTNVVDAPAGFVCMIDPEGKKWFESFWGILHVLDAKLTPTRWEVKSNALSFFPVFVVFEYPEPPVYSHTVTFHFPFKGILLLNPFLYLTLLPVFTSIGNFAFLPGKRWLAGYGASVENKLKASEKAD